MTGKVPIAPEDVERLLKTPGDPEYRAMIRALSAEVERLKTALRSIRKYSSSPYAEKTAREALGE